MTQAAFSTGCERTTELAAPCPPPAADRALCLLRRHVGFRSKSTRDTKRNYRRYVGENSHHAAAAAAAPPPRTFWSVRSEPSFLRLHAVCTFVSLCASAYPQSSSDRLVSGVRLDNQQVMGLGTVDDAACVPHTRTHVGCLIDDNDRHISPSTLAHIVSTNLLTT
nr:unnamed protein product [Spirometra erinaceieuropaei]